MDEKRMPVIFVGHGSPMIALEDSAVTRGMRDMGQKILTEYGRPKAILAISAHWYTRGTLLQSAPQPKQVYDMYGFPPELYALKYPAKGNAALTEAVKGLLGASVTVNDDWGIDHGTWSVLVHMFPEADIPVVQLSVNGELSSLESFQLGQRLHALRSQGYLILGSGNVVHNLRMVEWDSTDGTEASKAFESYITESLLSGSTDAVIHFEKHPAANYAVPTPDHYLPLLYCLGAAEGSIPEVFNRGCTLGAIAMTGYLFRD